MRNAHQELIRAPVEKLNEVNGLSSTFQTLIELYREQEFNSLQSDIVSVCEEFMFEQVMNRFGELALNTADRARLRACKFTSSGSFMTIVAESRELQMSDEHFIYAARFRLGLTPTDQMPRRCICVCDLTGDDGEVVWREKPKKKPKISEAEAAAAVRVD